MPCARFDDESNKTRLVRLLRRYGMGVPDAARALRSATDALTLIAQAQIRPYEGLLREQHRRQVAATIPRWIDSSIHRGDPLLELERTSFPDELLRGIGE
jgi:hypothetical protein